MRAGKIGRWVGRATAVLALSFGALVALGSVVYADAADALGSSSAVTASTVSGSDLAAPDATEWG
jgi:hypothetical protein